MAYVPRPLNPEWTGDIPSSGGEVPSITVHALNENKAPVGFAPWPEQPKAKKKRKRKKAR